MIKPKGLGRGLDALLGGSRTNMSSGDSTLREIAVNQLSAGKYQPRTRMDKVSLEELAQSIRSRGMSVSSIDFDMSTTSMMSTESTSWITVR